MSAQTVTQRQPDATTPPAGEAEVPASRVTCYSIRAAADPGLMSRVLELFAKRSLVPDRWHSDLVGADRAELSIDLQVRDLDPDTGAYIARCLRQIWGVEAVLTSEKGTA